MIPGMGDDIVAGGGCLPGRPRITTGSRLSAMSGATAGGGPPPGRLRIATTRCSRHGQAPRCSDRPLGRSDRNRNPSLLATLHYMVAAASWGDRGSQPCSRGPVFKETAAGGRLPGDRGSQRRAILRRESRELVAVGLWDDRGSQPRPEYAGPAVSGVAVAFRGDGGSQRLLGDHLLVPVHVAVALRGDRELERRIPPGPPRRAPGGGHSSG